MSTVNVSPFPKLSQLWRFVRLAGSGVAAQSVTGLCHVVWADRALIAAAAVGAVEVAYRRVFPSGRLSGAVAALMSAYRQITAAAKKTEPSASSPEAAVSPPAAPAA